MSTETQPDPQQPVPPQPHSTERNERGGGDRGGERRGPRGPRRDRNAQREEGGFKYDIEVDGGLNNHTIWEAVRAGAETIVAGTSVFSQVDLGVAIEDLRENARQAMAHLTDPQPTEEE